MRALVIVALLAGGCYDVDALTRSYRATTSDGGMPDGEATTTTDGGAVASWHAVDSPTTVALRGVASIGGGQFVAVGADSGIVRLAAGAAPSMESTTPGWNLRAVGAIAGGAVAVGDSEVVLTRDRGTWSGNSLGDATLYGVTAPGSGETLAVGSSGLIVHAVTGSYSVEDGGVVTALYGVVARAPGDAVAVGEGGVILRGSGGTTLSWSRDNVGTTANLYAVATNGSDVWAVGAAGTILFAPSGGAWTAEASGTSADLFAVAVAGDQVWAVGAGGTILVRQAGAWSLEHSGGADLRGVAADATAAWAVGDGGVIFVRQ